jgi:hypothetical protein
MDCGKGEAAVSRSHALRQARDFKGLRQFFGVNIAQALLNIASDAAKL